MRRERHGCRVASGRLVADDRRKDCILLGVQITFRNVEGLRPGACDGQVQVAGQFDCLAPGVAGVTYRFDGDRSHGVVVRQGDVRGFGFAPRFRVAGLFGRLAPVHLVVCLDARLVGDAVDDGIVVEGERGAGSSRFPGSRRVRATQRDAVAVDRREVAARRLPRDGDGPFPALDTHVGRCVRQFVRCAVHGVGFLGPADFVLRLHLERVGLAVAQPVNRA